MLLLIDLENRRARRKNWNCTELYIYIMVIHASTLLNLQLWAMV
jgi:hypothetical protein